MFSCSIGNPIWNGPIKPHVARKTMHANKRIVGRSADDTGFPRSVCAVHCGRLSWQLIVACCALAGCKTKPLIPYSTDAPPLALMPASQAGVQDKRARFREIYSAVLEARKLDLPDYRPCEDA